MHDIIQVCVQRPRGGVVVEHQAVSEPDRTVLNLGETSTNLKAINGLKRGQTHFIAYFSKKKHH